MSQILSILWALLFPSKEERSWRKMINESSAEYERPHGQIVIITGEIVLPKTNAERLQDAEKEEKDILDETHPATAQKKEKRL